MKNDEISVTPQYYGVSRETESSWEEFLGSVHSAFILEFVETEQATEEAAVNR